MLGMKKAGKHLADIVVVDVVDMIDIETNVNYNGDDCKSGHILKLL